MVIIGEVRVLSQTYVSLGNYVCDIATNLPTGGLPSIDFCNFDNFELSLNIFFTFAVFSTRSFDLNERLNMAAIGLDEVGRDRMFLERVTK
jgi:hypothetical protein